MKLHSNVSVEGAGADGMRAVAGRFAPRGFTLIELLVVMAIVSLLVAIMLPALQHARESARQIQCASQMRQVASGLISYIQNDRRGRMFTYREIRMSEIYYMGYFTAHYPVDDNKRTAGDKLFHCPSHPYPITHANAYMSHSKTSTSSTHYGWPMNHANRIPVELRSGTRAWYMHEVPSSARGVLLGETIYNNATRDARGEGSSSFAVYSVPGQLVPNKHGEMGNYAFMDGHVSSFEASFVLRNYASPDSPIRFEW